MSATKPAADGSRRVSWEALTYYNFYRFLVSFLFVSLYWIGQLPEPLGGYDSTLFAITSHVYLLVSVAAQLIVRLRTPAYSIQVAANVVFDICIITLMMYASAGLNSGFGMLLVIAVAGGSLLSSGKIGFLYAAIATILVLGHEVYVQLYHFNSIPNYTHAGFLGITFFATSAISHALANRVAVSEALAEERAIDLENLAILNEHIVQRLQSGILVLDDELNVILANESAKQLLGVDAGNRIISLSDVSGELADMLQHWVKGEGKPSQLLNLGHHQVDILASFTRLNLENKFGVLVFLEDVSTMRQRAQQMKQASLGRLTASIAHEIRNPLGAISHAGQLLNESDSISEENYRLVTIIDEQSRRVNSIIENVLGISRRQQAVPTEVNIGEWLEKFEKEFSEQANLDDSSMVLTLASRDINVTIDPEQLRQVMWNLCENGVRYSTREPLLKIQCGVVSESQRCYIDISDTGGGIDSKSEEQLFEPFFTTSSKGSGLGLYIARELCEANQATLSLKENTPEGCCFRIYFSHYEKQHNIM